MARRKKHSRWGHNLLTWVFCLLLAGACGIFGFYRYAAAYEVTRPELTMDELMESMTKADWKEALLKGIPEGDSPFENDRELYEGFFDAALADASFSYRRDMSHSTKNANAFVVYTGMVKVATVTLRAEEGGRENMGRSNWTVDSIVPAEFKNHLDCFAVSIEVPAKAEAALNGVVLGEEYRRETGIPYDNLTALELRYPEVPSLARYEVSNLYGSVTVTVDGEELAPLTELTDGVVAYGMREAAKYSFSIEAPAGIELSVCGASLSAADATGKGQDIFKGTERLSLSGYETNLYAYKGLYTLPELKASYMGTELQPEVGEDGTMYYFYPTDSEFPETAKAAAKKFFLTYLKFASHNGEASLWDVTALIAPNTELYSYVANSGDAMYWASATEMNFEELSFDHFHWVDENCFTCTAAYEADFTAQSWYEQYSYAMRNGYKLVFVRQYGMWYAAGMTAYGS